MNIIEAREAAMAGKTVISPSGVGITAVYFQEAKRFRTDDIFGEWRVEQEPVVFCSKVIVRKEGNWDTVTVYGQELRPLIGKNVRVTVEVIDEV